MAEQWMYQAHFRVGLMLRGSWPTQTRLDSLFCFVLAFYLFVLYCTVLWFDFFLNR